MAGLWHFDAGSGQVVADSSSYANNGYLGSTSGADANDPTWGTGKFGGALHFNGTSTFVQVPNSTSLAITGSITLEAWVKLDSYGSYQGVIGRWNDTISTSRGYALTIDNYRRVRFDVSHTGHYGAYSGPCTVATVNQLSCPDNAAVLSNAQIPIGRWIHVAGVFDSVAQTAQVFVNGTPDTSVATMASTIFDNGQPVLIGAADFTGTRIYLPGSIDEARIWKRALSAGELLSSAQAGLRGLWHFNNDGSDASGMGNDVAIVGPTFTPNSKFGSAALDFDGVNDYAYTGGDITLAITGPITVEAWVKVKARPVGNYGFGPIIAKWNDQPQTVQGRGYVLSITPDGSARFDVSHNGNYSCGLFNNFGPYSCATADSALVISNAKIPLNTWTHIAGVFDGSKLQIFVNGAPDTSIATKASNIWVPAFPIAFGFAYAGGGAAFSNTGIDEAKIWARPLSAAEIAFEAAGPTSAELYLPALIGQGHLPDNGGGDGSGAVYEPNFPAGTSSPAMFLEFVIPDAAGAQITSIVSHLANGNGASLAGAVTGNGGLDALVTGKTVNPPVLNLDMNLSDKTKVGVEFDWTKH